MEDGESSPLPPRTHVVDSMVFASVSIALAIVFCGGKVIVEGLEFIAALSTNPSESFFWPVGVPLVGYVCACVFLFAFRRFLARSWAKRVGDGVRIRGVELPSIEAAVAGGIALIGIWLLAWSAFDIVDLFLPFLVDPDATLESDRAWIVARAVYLIVSVLMVVKALAIARWWCRRFGLIPLSEVES